MNSNSQPALITDRVPPELFFITSAIFHYVGPAFAVLLFAHVAPPGVAWLRITSAAVIFAVWLRPTQILNARVVKFSVQFDY